MAPYERSEARIGDGNGVETSREYDPETGRLTDIVTSIGSTDLQVNAYGWRSNGILESRTAHPVAGLSSTRKETFNYDVLNRLELAETWINGGNTRDLSYQYNALGNIESKTSTLAGDTDVTGYSYSAGAGPHAVTGATVGGVFNTLLYDDNGAVTRYDIAGTTEDKWLAWNAANQPTKIVIGSGLDDTTPQVSEEFRYDPDGRRYARQSTWQEGGTTHKEHVTYVGNVEIVYDTSNGEVLWVYKTRISPSVMHVKAEWLGLIDGQPRSWNESHFEYAHRDHLGSIEVVTDDTGAELHRLAFEPFGSRKQKDWSGNIAASELNALLARGQGHAPRVRGFTDHEHLDRTGFIHMNGRIYDPVLGRFLSPDPFVQFTTASESWNRYSYVSNSPMSFTDPTGFKMEISGPDAAIADVMIVVGRRNGSSYWLDMSAFPIDRSLPGGGGGGRTARRETSNGGEGESDVDAEDNFNDAISMILAALESGALDIGLKDDYIRGGYESIKFDLVPDIENAVADVDFESFGPGPLVWDVVIRVDFEGAATLGEALQSIGHELRHLTVYNRSAGKQPAFPGGVPPNQRDAEYWGRKVREYFEQ